MLVAALAGRPAGGPVAAEELAPAAVQPLSRLEQALHLLAGGGPVLQRGLDGPQLLDDILEGLGRWRPTATAASTSTTTAAVPASHPPHQAARAARPAAATAIPSRRQRAACRAARRARLLFTDLVFWALKAYAPFLFARLLGTPKGLRLTPEQRIGILESEESLFPVRPRKQGVLYDSFVSNPDVQGYPLEEISVPTLLIHARDDGMAAFQNAARAAERIPGAELLAIDHGGHMLLGSEGLILREVARFLTGSRVG